MTTEKEPTVDPRCTHRSAPPGQIYIDGAYLERNPTWHAEDSRWKAEKCAALLSELAVKPKMICDVGCGVGGVLAAFADAYPAAALFGFDISPAAIELAKERHSGIEFAAGSLTGYYDLILALDVIEHVEDCFGFTRRLQPHGDLFLFNIPLELTCLTLLRNGFMPHRRAFGHIHYFSRETALALLTDCGYQIVSCRYLPAVVDFAAHDLKSRALTTIQRAGFRIAPHLSVLTFGGYSLLVAARPGGGSAALRSQS